MHIAYQSGAEKISDDFFLSKKMQEGGEKNHYKF